MAESKLLGDIFYAGRLIAILRLGMTFYLELLQTSHDSLQRSLHVATFNFFVPILLARICGISCNFVAH